jgi:hypothetical protein
VILNVNGTGESLRKAKENNILGYSGEQMKGIHETASLACNGYLFSLLHRLGTLSDD